VDRDGIVIDGYSDAELLGRGASSIVYRATQDSTGVERAIKVFVGTTADFRRQFRREKKALASLRHPGIVAIIDAGTASSGEPYLVTALYLNGSLADRLDRPDAPAFTPEEVARIGIDIADALQAAHAGGWVHRDIKPANILVRGDEVALADFGIARGAEVLDRTGSLDWATPMHAAPETMCGNDLGEVQPPSAIGDVYSLGSTLYTLLAGRAPFQASLGSHDSMPAFLGRLCDKPLRPIDRADLSPAWQAFFERALAKQPERRFSSAADLRAALVELSGAASKGPARSVVDPDLRNTIDLGATPRRQTPQPVTIPDAAPAQTAVPPAVSEALGNATEKRERPVAQQTAAEPDPEPDRARPPWMLIGAISAVVLILVIALVALRPGSDADASNATTTNTVATNKTKDVTDLAPTSVALDDTATPLRVTWEDHGGGQYPYLVISARAGEQPSIVQAPAGATSAELPDLDATDQACVFVAMLLDEQEQARSQPACMNGAVPPATTTTTP
jgi:serine/threonine protein kinase